MTKNVSCRLTVQKELELIQGFPTTSAATQDAYRQVLSINNRRDGPLSMLVLLPALVLLLVIVLVLVLASTSTSTSTSASASTV